MAKKSKGPAEKLPSIPTKLHQPSARKLAELARLEGLDSVAVCFDTHFLADLDDLLIAAAEKRLHQLREEKRG